MTDDEIFQLLGAYHDGELSPGETLDMERRLAADPALCGLAARLGTLSGGLREALATPPSSPTLRARIVEAIGFADPAPRRRMPQQWRSLAAMLLIGLVGGGLAGSGAVVIGLGSRPEPMAEAVLAGHLRGLIAPQPYDFASSNRHVVKPWFNGRTTIAPQAPDLADQGFPLIGGRIDIVDGKAVPTLVYRRDQHVISVTITPRTAKTGADEEHRGGSTIERWNADDLTYWTVSDLDVQDLRTFIEMFRAQIVPKGR